MNPIQSVSEVQTPNSNITTHRPLSKQINTHTADSWEHKNLRLKADVNDCVVASYCIYVVTETLLKRTKRHKHVEYSARCDAALNDGFQESCC